MSKLPEKIYDFFLAKQVRIQDGLSQVNESDNDSLSILNEEDNLSQSKEFVQVTVDSILPDSRTANYKFDIGLYVSGNIPVEKEFRLKILSSCWMPPEDYKISPIIQEGELDTLISDG